MTSALISAAGAIVALLALWRCGKHAKSAAGDAISAAAAARAAAASVALVDNITTAADITAEPGSIPPGALSPTVPIDLRRYRDAARRTPRNFSSPSTSSASVRKISTPGAGADIPRAGGRAKP